MPENTQKPSLIREALGFKAVAQQYDFLEANMGNDPHEVRTLGMTLTSGADNYCILVGSYLLHLEAKGLDLALGRRSAMEFATKDLGFSETTARRNMKAAKLAIMVREEFPELNQSQALALEGIKASSDEEARKIALKVLKKAKEVDGVLSARKIAEAINSLQVSSGGTQKDPHREFLLGTLGAKETAEQKLTDQTNLSDDQKQALSDYAKAAQRVLELLAL
ncbi:MAG: hypothetical protein ACP5I4_11985 [Oceanipulchritudo sp.]